MIATEDSNIGMGGPAMIEGGGLGVHAPEDVGPIDVQDANGVVDLRVADEAEAVAAAKRYLSYFDPAPRAVDAAGRPARPDPRGPQAHLRRPRGDRRADRRARSSCDAASAPAIVTALARVEGRPLGIVANHPAHLGGAIDAPGADKAARFLQLCDAFDLPILFLCDTPGFMVGPDAEQTATVRHFARLFVTGANVTVPVGTIVLRKGYGLGAQAMAAGQLQGAAVHGRLADVGVRRRWASRARSSSACAASSKRSRTRTSASAPSSRRAAAYEHGQGLNMAAYGEIDDVIDPNDSRRWIATLFTGRHWRDRTQEAPEHRHLVGLRDAQRNHRLLGVRGQRTVSHAHTPARAARAVDVT